MKDGPGGGLAIQRDDFILFERLWGAVHWHSVGLVAPSPEEGVGEAVEGGMANGETKDYNNDEDKLL